MQQAIQLGVLPRLDVRQTSDERIGQVYVTLASRGCGHWARRGFQQLRRFGQRLRNCVAGDMLITSFLVAIGALGVSPLIVIVVAALFLSLDGTFVLANIHKTNSPATSWNA